MTTSEHEAAAASAATPTGADDSDTNGLSRRDVLQLAGSAVFVVGVPPGTTRAATSTGEEAFAMASVRLTVNGQARQLALDPRQSLLDVLRETLDLTGTKKGCNQGACGACTMLLDGRRIVSCLTLAAMHDGAEIRRSRASRTATSFIPSGGLHRARRPAVRLLHARARSCPASAASQRAMPARPRRSSSG